MFRRPATVACVLLLFLTACGSGKDESSKASAQDNGEKSTAVATTKTASSSLKVYPTATSVATAPATAAGIPTPSTPAAAAPLSQSSTGQEGADLPSDLSSDKLTLGLLWEFQPMLLLSQMIFGGAEGEGMSSGLGTLDRMISGEANRRLSSTLVSLDDLPQGYYLMFDRSGELSVSPDHQSIALRWFMSEDPATKPMMDEVITQVSAVAVEIADGAETDLENALREAGKAGDCGVSLGVPNESSSEEGQITECRVSELPDLGDVGIEIRMVMDTGGDVGSMYFDSYLFKLGREAFALHVTGTNGDASGLDGLALAKVMDSRAQAAMQ